MNGTEYDVSSTSNGAEPPVFTATFSQTVALVEGENPFEIGGRGLCGNLTELQAVVITRAPDLCAAPVFDLCTEPALGSVFYVALVDGDGDACRLPCTIAGPDQAPVCDVDAIACP